MLPARPPNVAKANVVAQPLRGEDLPPPILPQPVATWSYLEAFKRNRGLISESEQQRLRNCRVAIAGMGGVGGIHLATLTRLGIGKFTIADPDSFEVANFNRQYGATQQNLGRNKADAMAEIALAINPDLDLRMMPVPIHDGNMDEFLEGADLLVDSLDAFSVALRRRVFRQAAERGIYGIGAGPVGFSTVWITFAPNGMSFDDYFCLTDDQDGTNQFLHYIVGMAPKATHRSYIDTSYVNISERYGPSVSAACHLASGVLGTEAVKILLGRGRVRSAPYYHQFDPFVGKFVRGRLRNGNRSVFQRMKISYLRRLFIS
jgi:molybdopterin/thiamine biosynthesis adenylyltransferase